MPRQHLSVSVVISTYNRAALLPEAIECLLQQTRVPDQIVVVDDGSTDNTQDVLKEFGPPVFSCWQENQGLSAGRNTGLGTVTGDLIAFLDSDDLLAPESIEKRASILMEDAGYDVVYSNVLMTSLDGTALGLYTKIRPGPRPTGGVFSQFAQYNLMPIHAFMFRRTCLDRVDGFDADLRSMEDYELWLRMAAHFQFYYLDEPLAVYRLHDTMMSLTQRTQMIRNQLLVQRRIYDMPAFQTLAAVDKATILMKHGILYMLVGQSRRARAAFWAAISSAPSLPHPYGLLVLSLLGGRVFNAIHSTFQKLRGDLTFGGA